MGSASEYFYGPVTSYSIKSNMAAAPGFGWTWGTNGQTPIAALDYTGKMQLAGSFNSHGIRVPGVYTYTATGIPTGIELEVPGDVKYNAIRAVAGSTLSSSIIFFDPTWQSGAAGISAGAINVDGATSVTRGVWNNPLAYFRKSDGFVGIGTTNPDAKLSVKGQVHAQEVKVDIIGSVAPDYVFAEGYKLPSLDEVKAYIDKHQHLPEVPSAKELEANGINVGEMNLLLLRKIEELTLYVIDLKKQNDVQQEEINRLTNSKK